MDAAVQDGLLRAAQSLGISHRRMPSGGGHDAAAFAAVALGIRTAVLIPVLARNKSVIVKNIDPLGSTVTLVRSGVAAGKSFRFAEEDAPSVTAQLSAALGAFGWLVSNLDAIVVTVDEAIDPTAAQLVAQSFKTGLGVRSALAPEPHQTMVRGAALAAAAGSVDLLGSTQILPVARLTGPKRSELDTETTTVIAKITATPPPPETTGTVRASSPAPARAG